MMYRNPTTKPLGYKPCLPSPFPFLKLGLPSPYGQGTSQPTTRGLHKT